MGVCVGGGALAHGGQHRRSFVHVPRGDPVMGRLMRGASWSTNASHPSLSHPTALHRPPHPPADGVDYTIPFQLKLQLVLRNLDEPGQAPMMQFQAAALANFAVRDILRNGPFVKVRVHVWAERMCLVGSNGRFWVRACVPWEADGSGVSKCWGLCARS